MEATGNPEDGNPRVHGVPDSSAREFIAHDQDHAVRSERRNRWGLFFTSLVVLAAVWLGAAYLWAYVMNDSFPRTLALWTVPLLLGIAGMIAKIKPWKPEPLSDDSQ